MSVKRALYLGLSLIAFASSAQSAEPFAAQRQQVYAAFGHNRIWHADALPHEDFVDSLLLVAQGNGLSDQTAQADEIKRLLSDEQARQSGAAETALLDWMLELAHALNGDDLPLAQLYTGWTFTRSDPKLPVKLLEALRGDDLVSFLVSLAPHDADYLHLIQALKLYRVMETNGGWKPIASGPTLKPGMRDERVRQVRERLMAEGYALPQCRDEFAETTFDNALKEVMAAYQLRNGLDPDGSVGALTLATMNKPVSYRIDQIRANMARLRAMPREWPARAALVNIADSSARFQDGLGKTYLAPVVVGRPDRKTPFIASAINSVILNPTWSVPAKIAREDILPKLKKDPHYLEKMGFVIQQNENDPHGAQIDWDQVKKSEFTLRLRQAAGELNALGPIKFDFNNDYAVYMHGTPHKEAFAKADRHLSSGCVRLQQPDAVAEMVLSGNTGSWTQEKVNQEIASGSRRWIKVQNPMPVYFVYQTVFFPNGSTLPDFRRDLYNYDRPVIAAMQQADK